MIGVGSGNLIFQLLEKVVMEEFATDATKFNILGKGTVQKDSMAFRNLQINAALRPLLTTQNCMICIKTRGEGLKIGDKLFFFFKIWCISIYMSHIILYYYI